MKNGTSQAVLVRDLFSGSGPFEMIADDFVAQRCGLCSADHLEDMRFVDDGFYCGQCSSLMVG